jgi:adenylate cyclase
MADDKAASGALAPMADGVAVAPAPQPQKEKKKRRFFAGKKFSFGTGRLVALAILVGLVALRIVDPTPLQLLRVKTFDIYQQIKPRQVSDQRPVMVVDLDDRSLREIGQWPWPRTTVAALVDRLTAMGAIVIGFDVVFAEPDRMSPAVVAGSIPGLDDETRSRLEGMPSNDAFFAQSIANSRVVLGMSARTTKAEDQNAQKPMTSVASIGADPDPWLNRYADVLRNVDAIDRASSGRGLFNITGELDGIVRRVPMMALADGQRYGSLSVEMLRVAFGQQTIVIKTAPQDGVEMLRIGKAVIRTDANAQTWVYFSHYDRDKYISAIDVLNGTVDPAKIAGRLILLGTSAVGLLDIKASPLDSFLPGVEVHANILENVIEGTQLNRPRDAVGKELILTAIAGLLMIILVPLVGARLTVVMLAVFILGTGGVSWWYFADELTLYDPVYPTVTAITLYMFLTYSNYAREEAERRQVRDAFSRYMSPALVERLAEDPSRLQLGGEMRDMTLLFCDVRGFTTISEQFSNDPQGLTKLINRFLTPMTNVILERQGTIDKYMGDCIMAFWNAPLDDDRHSANACRSALAMIDCMRQVNVELKAEADEKGVRYFPLNVGIGLNSGNVCVGNMGSDQRFDYSVLGDSVNLASRLEGQSKTYGVTIVIGESTRNEAPDYAAIELDLIKVKGKTLPVRIFTLLGDSETLASEAFKTLAARHQQMLDCYRAQDWDGTQQALNDCRTQAEAMGATLGGLYDLYQDRLDTYREAPPGDDWDGVFTATSK